MCGAMTLAIAAVLLTALAALSVWWAADRFWHAPAVLILALPLFPLAASQLTGDVSRYLPAYTFSKGIEGKDQIMVASAAASLLVAIILAACIWGVAKMIWRGVPKRSK